MNLTELKEKIDSDLAKQLVTPSILLDRLRVINESSRQSGPYYDPRYAPFFYYLGKYVPCVNLMEIGFGTGLFSCCFLTSCKTVENFYAFQTPDKTTFYSPKLGYKNVRYVWGPKKNFQFYSGNILDKNWGDVLNSVVLDLALFNEERDYDTTSLYLDFVWEKLKDDGLLVMDYIESHGSSKKAFFNFCKKNNREPVTFSTRYGVGIIQK